METVGELLAGGPDTWTSDVRARRAPLGLGGPETKENFNSHVAFISVMPSKVFNGRLIPYTCPNDDGVWPMLTTTSDVRAWRGSARQHFGQFFGPPDLRGSNKYKINDHCPKGRKISRGLSG